VRLSSKKNKKEIPKDAVLSMSGVFKTGSSGGKFGLGAFEDADDEDVYTSENSENYDNILLGEREAQIAAKLAAKKKQIESEPTYSNDTARCSDGSLPLRGFRISTRPLEKPKVWGPPVVPPDYKPFHKFGRNSSMTAGHFTSVGSSISSQERGKLLGEKNLSNNIPSNATSVFDLLAPEDRKKLASLTGKFISATDEKFINEPTPEQISLTEWERREKDKIFEETAAKFKPLNNMMSQRFTKGTTQIGDKTISAEDLKKEQEYKVESYQETAAAMKMYGKMTRKVETWFPSGLLCKRFNLKNPHQGKKQEDKKKPDLLAGLQLQIPIENQNEKDLQQPEQQQYKPQDLIEDIKEENDNEEIIEPDKPPIDIFKAIFEEDEDEKKINSELQEKSSVTKLTPQETQMDEPQILLVEPDEIEKIVPKLDSMSQLEKEIEKTEIEHSKIEPVTNTEISTRKPEDNPYVYYPPKRETRGGPASASEAEPIISANDITKTNNSDSSDNSKISSKDIKEKKDKHKKGKKEKKT